LVLVMRKYRAVLVNCKKINCCSEERDCG